MPVFHYHATDERGRAINGSMPAQDESNLEEKLESSGFWLIDATIERGAATTAKKAEAKLGGASLWGRKKRRALIEFCTMMSFQSRVGIPLVQALEVASEDCETVAFRGVLAGLQRHIESGLLFYEALEKYPRRRLNMKKPGAGGPSKVARNLATDRTMGKASCMILRCFSRYFS